LNLDSQPQVTGESIDDVFKLGDKTIVIASISNDNLVIDMIVGYGCKAMRNIKL